jgi:murein DD-endopeptidase MepM/ murein hydrolase activator NlpD
MLKNCFLLFTNLVLCYFNSLGQATNQEIYNAKHGLIKKDTSPVYLLPYPKGTKHLLIQGYNSKFSHKGELSLDFKMKVGSAICAARAGVVSATEASNTQGGAQDKYLDKGNYIIINHNDGTSAWYWHLMYNGVKVAIGDTIVAGQLIGYSGNTGYSAFPHLHFQVHKPDGGDVLTRFKTKKGIKYLRPGRWYKRKH